MPTLDEIHGRLGAYRARVVPDEERPPFQAAVSLILHETPGTGPELLFIERAAHPGDPWSGHMALPGGRRDPVDADLSRTAARETLEEVGVTLPEPFAALDHFSGTRRSPQVPALLVAPYLYSLEKRPEVVANYEVESTVWIPVRWIVDPESWVSYEFEREGQTHSYPAFQFDRYVVWGLTYRILRGFTEILGRPIPAPPED